MNALGMCLHTFPVFFVEYSEYELMKPKGNPLE